MFGAEHLLVDTCYINISFGSEARRIEQFIGIKTEFLAESTLGLLDGHTLRNADVYMTLAASRISLTQHHVVPLRLLILVYLQSFCESLTHQLGVVDIHARHKRESLGYDGVLCAMIVLEGRVVRTDKRQPVLLLLPSGTDVGHIPSEPLLAEQLVKLLRGLCFCIAPIVLTLVGEMLRVQCNQTLFHTVSSFLELK